MYALPELGWTDSHTTDFEPHAAAGYLPARVAAQHRGVYVLFSELGELRADMAGRLSHEAAGAGELPAVGDWVAIAARPDEGAATIHAVLPRRTKFSRKVALGASEEQVLAANVDTVFLLTSLNEDFNLRRLERYITMAWESGAQPVIVLTKTDLDPDYELRVREVEAIAFGVPVYAISNLTGAGLDLVRTHIVPGQTIALLGSSGVGKSTLVNTLAGEELLATQEIREDDGEGRHTTTHRQLVLLPGGGLVLDTPGLRELQLWESADGLAETFGDVEALAANCRFTDCAHASEPDCAVQAALADGTLPPERWESYEKLQRELAHLERRLDKRLQADERKRWAKAGAEGRANMLAKRRP
ncbi:MAG: ribosome biosis GTPase / thiamine phosphate phosphatase [Gaiellaceae bacterium]|nr:ribosome biosis GTPase / thiamine phosphate phosphatase [Gaiellaceae bacterium]